MTCKECSTHLTIENSNTGNSPVLCNICFESSVDYERAEDLEYENANLQEQIEENNIKIEDLTGQKTDLKDKIFKLENECTCGC